MLIKSKKIVGTHWEEPEIILLVTILLLSSITFFFPKTSSSYQAKIGFLSGSAKPGPHPVLLFILK